MSCGVVADTTAATVSGRTISVSDVDLLASSPGFIQLLQREGQAVTPQDSRVPGTAARSALQFELERTAYIAMVDDLGLSSDASVAEEADTWVAQQEARLQDPAPLDARVRELLVSYIENQLLVYEYVGTADLEDRTLLERFYGRLSGRWDQRCVTVVGADAAQMDELGELRRRGLGVEQIAEQVDGSEIVIDAASGCVARVDLPGTLVSAIDRLRPGSTSEAVELDGAVYVIRLDGRREVTLEEAAGEIRAIFESSAQSGPQALIAGDLAEATINPRYGQGVLPTGVVIAPPTPIRNDRPVLDALAGGQGS